MTTTVKNILHESLGHKLLFMLGADNYVQGDNYVTFKIKGSKKVTHISVKLQTNDLYEVTFYKISGMAVGEKKQFIDVQVTNLHKLIEENTSLKTKLF